MPQKRVRFRARRWILKPPAVSLDAALRRTTRDYERDPTTEADDTHRPFDIASRTIQLLFPGTAEDDIELPAFKFSRCPSGSTGAGPHLGAAGCARVKDQHAIDLTTGED